MSDLTEGKRSYQAEVHFALGAVIQGVTVAALGSELAGALKNLPLPGAQWVFVTGLQSLLVAIAFWYKFMDDYFFGFRVINMTAWAHFQFAAVYLVLGLLQLIAIQFLAAPRSWLTVYVIMIGTTVASSWITRHITVIANAKVQQALNYDPGSKLFVLTFALALGCLLLWHIVPGLDTGFFAGIALAVSGASLLLFIVYSIRVFQRHLDTEW
jgi:subtilisin family serine protease